VKAALCGFWGGAALLIALTSTALADDAQEREAAIKTDRQLLEGTWRIVAFEINGNKAVAEDARKLCVINGPGDTWSVLSEAKETAKGTNVLNPTKKPKAIDFTITEGGGKGNTYLGIYELGEKSRKVCFAPPGKERPSEFTSTPDSELILVTFERET
jgi:uncharacterized protein (TIGR03067 family)